MLHSFFVLQFPESTTVKEKERVLCCFKKQKKAIASSYGLLLHINQSSEFFFVEKHFLFTKDFASTLKNMVTKRLSI